MLAEKLYYLCLVKEPVQTVLILSGDVGRMKSGRLPGYPVTQMRNSHRCVGNSVPTARKAETQMVGDLTGFCHTL